MNYHTLEQTIEYILRNMTKEEMISAINSHSEKFIELMELALMQEHKLSPSAAWLLSHCAPSNLDAVRSYIPKMVAVLPRLIDGHQRDLIRVLCLVELDEEQEGRVFDSCVEIWSSINKIPSVRWFAMKLILQIAGSYPELAGEIKLLRQDFYLDTLSPGIKNSIVRLITDFEKQITL